MATVAVFGYGTVGSGVVEVIEKNSEMVSKKAGVQISVKYVLDLRDFPGDPIQDRIVHDVDVILNDPEISIICETMGGNEPAYTFSKKALLAGKSVCTSNKELVANHGPELIQIAAEHNCNYLFEASVGGGIPIIRPLNECTTPEYIEEISGILNGTTNYILTKMADEGADFADVLKDAQAKGYAEKNPEADVEGFDACRKIAILSSLMSGKTVDFKEIYTEGITKITSQDFFYAKKMKCAIKLLASSKQTADGLVAMVAPVMVSQSHPLYSVNDVFNGILVRGNMLGDVMFYGRGAGKLPTASAVVGDVIECAKFAGKHLDCFWTKEKQELTSVKDSEKAFFVRIDKAKCSALEAKKVFGEGQVVEVTELPQEFAYITKCMSEKDFEEKSAKIAGMLTRIRMEASAE